MDNGKLPDYLSLPDRKLAYRRLQGQLDKPGVVFLGGHASDMTGTKAGFLAERCAAESVSYVCFDYRGNGRSSGAFRDGTIGAWLDDAREVVQRVTGGPQVVVGSSMGGWIGLLLAAELPERVKAFVGIAAAPDFTEDLVWNTLTEKQRAMLLRDGDICDENAPPDHRVPITLKLIEEGRNHLLLGKPVRLSCPVRLLHGMKDAEVPWQTAMRILDGVTCDDARATFVKDGEHRLSRPHDLDLLWRTVAEFL